VVELGAEAVQEVWHAAMPGHIMWHHKFHQCCMGPLGSA
jgi:hypothetical protein